MSASQSAEVENEAKGRGVVRGEVEQSEGSRIVYSTLASEGREDQREAIFLQAILAIHSSSRENVTLQVYCPSSSPKVREREQEESIFLWAIMSAQGDPFGPE